MPCWSFTFNLFGILYPPGLSQSDPKGPDRALPLKTPPQSILPTFAKALGTREHRYFGGSGENPISTISAGAFERLETR